MNDQFRLTITVMCLVTCFICGCGDRAGGVNIWSAVKANKPADIRRYVEHGGEISTIYKSGRTPLMYALEQSCLESFEELLELGADPNIPTQDGRTVTAWAIGKKESLTYLRLALEHDADPNQLSFTRASKSKQPALRFAINNGTVEHTELLIKHGADIDYLYEKRSRPLLQAMGSGKFDIALLLLKSGADYAVKDTEPFSFLEYIRQISDRHHENVIPVSPEMRKQIAEIEAWLKEHDVEY